MEDLILNKTMLTPQINFQRDGSMVLRGVSTPEDVTAFYQPVLDWINKFKATKPKQVNFVMEVDYLNTSSSHSLVQILNSLNALRTDGTNVSFVWRYDEEDEDMLDLGNDLQVSSKSTIEFVAVKKN